METKQLFIGDPSYCLTDDLYHNVWGKKYDYKDGVIADNGQIIGIVHGTYSGDGSYEGRRKDPYVVDSGCLSVIDMSLFQPRFNEDRLNRLGLVVDCDKDGNFDLAYDNGSFTITWTLNGDTQSETIETNE